MRPKHDAPEKTPAGGPPAILQRIARALVTPEQQETVLGDLEEIFRTRVPKHGRTRAVLAHVRDLLSLLRSPYARIQLPGTSPRQSWPRWEVDVDRLFLDLRYAARNLRKRRSFVLVAVISLGLGIGANTAIFSVVHALVLAPLPYPDADRLVVLWETNEEVGAHRVGPSGATFMDWRDRSTSFEEMALFQPGSATITGLGEPEQVPGMRVTTNFPDLLGAELAIGRSFRPEEGRGGRQNVVLLSYGYWQRRFGGDPEILGREFTGDGIPYEVIGVLAESYWFPVGSDLLVPWDEAELRDMPREWREHAALARLRPGVELDTARAEMTAIAKQLGREHDELNGWGVSLAPASESVSEHLRPALMALLGAVGFVLLIACLNVANLLLARGTERTREIAIRAATGASLFRLLRQLFTESLLLAVAGGAVGILIGSWGLELLTGLLPSRVPIPGASGHLLLPDIAINETVLLFTFLVALVTGILFGIGPALQMRGIDLNGALKQAGRGGASTSGRHLVRKLLVAAEVSFAMMLVTGAALMIVSFANLSRVDVGFRAGGLLTMQLEVPIDSKYQERRDRATFYRRILEKLRATPGVTEAGISEILPLDDELRRRDFDIEGRLRADGEPLWADYNLVDAGFFRALGIPLLKGRLFDERDDADRPPVVLVDATFAARFFPATEPLGRRLLFPTPMEIVGVVGPLRSAGLDREPQPTIYFPYLQIPDDRMSFVLRASGVPGEELVRPAKRAVWAIDPDQPVYNVRPMEEVVAGSAAAPRLTLILLGIFGGIALLMASVGIYGVMAYTVSQRTQEIGLRQAFGAAASDLRRMVVGEALRLALAGVLVGGLGALAITRALDSLLYGVSATDPAALLAVAVFLTAVSLVAAYFPARRAAAIDPMTALRSE